MRAVSPPRPANFAEAVSTVGPHLRTAENLLHFATATLVPTDGQTSGMTHGTLYMTTRRIIFWPATNAAPDFEVDLSEIRAVAIDERPLADGYTMVAININGGEVATLITEPEVVASLAKAFPNHDEAEELAHDYVEDVQAERVDPAEATGGPAGAGASKPQGPVLDRARPGIRFAPLNPGIRRTLAPATFRRSQIEVRQFLDYSSGQPIAAIRRVLDSYIDELARDIRREMQAGRIAPCPDAGVHESMQFGAAISLSEQDCGWDAADSTHPIVHASLFLVQQGLVDEYGLGAVLPLEASYRCARSGRYVNGVFETYAGGGRDR